MRKKFISYFLIICMVVTMLPGTAFAANPNVVENPAVLVPTAGNVVNPDPASATKVANNTGESASEVTWDANTTNGWYIVQGEGDNGTITIDKRITVSGEVNLILADGWTLDAKAGITVEDPNSLTIWSQEGGRGYLDINKNYKDDNTVFLDAAIGGLNNGTKSGAITINGGDITANSKNGAGIGGAYGKDAGPIEINGGNIVANNVSEIEVNNGGDAAGIGAGKSFDSITINGGVIKEAISYLGAGIGAGSEKNITENNGTITINEGAKISTVKSRYGAGIGGGRNVSGGNININGGKIRLVKSNSIYDWHNEQGACIGGGENAAGGNINIRDGNITIESKSQGAAIGGGYKGAAGNINIEGGTLDISAFSDEHFPDGDYGKGSGIGVGALGEGGNVTITKGHIESYSSKGSGIGGTSVTYSNGTNGNAVIYSNSINDVRVNSAENRDWSGFVFLGNKYGSYANPSSPYLGRVYGNEISPVLDQNLTIEKDQSLTIGENNVLKIAKGTTLTNKNKIILDGGVIDDAVCTADGGEIKVPIKFNKGNFGDLINPSEDGLYKYKETLPKLDNSEFDGWVNEETKYTTVPLNPIELTATLVEKPYNPIVETNVNLLVPEDIVQDNLIAEATRVQSSTKKFETSESEGWYVAKGDGPSGVITVNSPIEVNGDTNLILADGWKVDFKSGISVNNGNSLTIWGQSGKTGELIASAKNNDDAAIGGSTGANDEGAGKITINGGVIKASSSDGAAIGSAKGKNSGKIVINDGNIDVDVDSNGAGIGTGEDSQSSGTIDINGGNIKALTYNGPGIGSGIDNNSNYHGENIKINGGEIVLAAKGYNSYLINTYGIDDNEGKIEITGGKIVTAGEIGELKYYNKPSVSISGNPVIFAEKILGTDRHYSNNDYEGYILFIGRNSIDGQVYGNPVLENDIELGVMDVYDRNQGKFVKHPISTTLKVKPDGIIKIAKGTTLKNSDLGKIILEEDETTVGTIEEESKSRIEVKTTFDPNGKTFKENLDGYYKYNAELPTAESGDGNSITNGWNDGQSQPTSVTTIPLNPTTLTAVWKDRPAAPAEDEGYTVDYKKETVTPKDGYEISIEGAAIGFTKEAVNFADKLKTDNSVVIHVRKAATDNDIASATTEALTITRQTTQSTVSEIAYQETSGKFKATVKTTEKGETLEYGIQTAEGEIQWQSSNVFTGLEKETEYTFYVRVAATDNSVEGTVSNGVKKTTPNIEPPKPIPPVPVPPTPNPRPDHEVTKPETPKVPEKGAEVGMTEKDDEVANNVLGGIIKDVIDSVKPGKPDPEKPGKPDQPKPEIPMTQAEKETAETKDKMKEAVENDETIRIKVETNKVNEKEIKKDAEKIENKLFNSLGEDGTEILQFADINIKAQVVKNGNVVRELGNIRVLDHKISFTFQLPKNEIASEDAFYGVVRIHDGKVQILPYRDVEIDKETNQITFKTDRFSTYAVYKYDPNSPALKVGSIDKIPDQYFDSEGEKPKVVVRDANGNPMDPIAYEETWTETEKTVTVTVTGIAPYNGTASQTFNKKDKPVKPEPPKPDKPSRPSDGQVVKSMKVITEYGMMKLVFDKSMVPGVKGYRLAIRQVDKDGKGIKPWKYFYNTKNQFVVRYLYGQQLKHNGKYQLKVSAVFDKAKGDMTPYINAGYHYANRVGKRAAIMYRPRFVSVTSHNGTVKMVFKDIRYEKKPQRVNYKLSYKLKGAKKWTFTKYGPSNKRVVKGLKVGKTYRFALRYRYKTRIDNKTQIYSICVYRNYKVK